MKLWDQITIINNAEKVVNLIGANCDNIIFVNDSCQFFILYPKFCKNWARTYEIKLLNCKPIVIMCGDKFNRSTDGDPLNCPWKINLDNPNIIKYLLND